MEFGGMTRTTLKTLWFAGGGLLATWFAVTPTNAPSAQPAATSIAGASDSRKQSIDELTTQEARLRQHLDVLPPKPTARNPFRFAGRTATTATAPARPLIETPPPTTVQAMQPPLRLSGIAEQKVNQATVRTAVISGDGQLYLVREGDTVAGRYRVATIDSDAVTLRDDTGGDMRLALR